MSNRTISVKYENFEDLDEVPAVRNMSRPRPVRGDKRQPKPKPKRAEAEIIAQLAEQADGKENFDFTYHASRHEWQWIVDALGGFYENQWLEDVLSLIQGGKEAHVYKCLANPSVKNLQSLYLSAKVYRPRRFRNLKNDHVYREGREHLDGDGRTVTEDGMLHAMSQRSAYGLQLLHTSWLAHEFKTMQILHAAGADVPAPYASSDNAILMAYIGGDVPAPTLNQVALDRDEAGPLFERVLHNIEIMLANDRVHADLSAYNILYWEGEIILIDFPQAIDPNANRNAYRIFERDITRVCEYFARQGVRRSPKRLAAELWTAYNHRLDVDVHPVLLDADDARDRTYWIKASQMVPPQRRRVHGEESRIK